MKKKEYQTGSASATDIEKGFLSNLLVERSNTGWTLKAIERYFSKERNEESFFWVLERDCHDGK